MSPTEPITIGTLAAQAATTDFEGFAEAVGMGALIGSLPAGTGEWAYHTNVRTSFSPALPGIELASSIVFPLRKTQPTFKDTILIGRASSNDICIPHTSISKLHARVRTVDGQVVISDAGSSNGTRVDNEKVFEETPLAQGAYIDMGDCTFIFYEAKPLYDAALQLHRG